MLLLLRLFLAQNNIPLTVLCIRRFFFSLVKPEYCEVKENTLKEKLMYFKTSFRKEKFAIYCLLFGVTQHSAIELKNNLFIHFFYLLVVYRKVY